MIAGLIPVSFLRPWIGVLAWSWIAYMAPHRLAWGFAFNLPVAMMIGVATIAGFVIAKDKKPLPRVAEVWLILLLAAHFTLTTLLAINPELAWGKWDWVFKGLLIAFVTIWLFQDRSRLRALFMVITLSIGFYGLKGGLWVFRTGGVDQVWGPENTFFGDNNTLGLALCMALPLMLGMAREVERWWLKWTFRVIFAFSIVAVLFTHSRGAFLALAVILTVMAWRSPWRLRFATAVALAAVIALPFIPLNLQERLQSIKEYDQDRSVLGRFQAWTVGYNLAMDRPLTGGGFRAYLNESVWKTYHPGEYIDSRDSHSLYFEVLGEHGVLGFALYLALLVATVVSLSRIRRRWRKHPEHQWLARYAEMIQLSLYPFLIAGAFLGVAYFDLYFHLVAITIVLKGLSIQAEQRVAADISVPSPAVARTRHVARPAA
jgi:probable O-glycosylation ligase (exosortase A-associated)